MLTVKQARSIAKHPCYFHDENLIETMKVLIEEPRLLIKVKIERGARARVALTAAVRACEEFAPDALTQFSGAA